MGNKRSTPDYNDEGISIAPRAIPVRSASEPERDNDVWARSVCIAQYPFSHSEYPLNGARVVMNFVTSGHVNIPGKMMFGNSVRSVIVINDPCVIDAHITRIVDLIIDACARFAVSRAAILIPQVSGVASPTLDIILPSSFANCWNTARLRTGSAMDVRCQFADMSLPMAINVTFNAE